MPPGVTLDIHYWGKLQASVRRVEGDTWDDVATAHQSGGLRVEEVPAGTYALFAQAPPAWTAQSDWLLGYALNLSALILDDLEDAGS